jgi:hypothetical protein
MTLYATGIRYAELTRLKVSDVDSKRMVIHIQGGKGRRDRDVMLRPKLLAELRAHWQRLHPKPRRWLFPGKHTSGEQPIDTKTVWHVAVAIPIRTRGLFMVRPPQRSSMQVRPLSTYSVFGEKNVSLKDRKSLKISKFLISRNGSAFQRDEKLDE